MYRIMKVDEANRNFVISRLRENVIKNAFAIYDLLYELDFTEFYVALRGESYIDGYLLIYKRLKYPSIILEGNTKTAELLLRKIDMKQFIMSNISCELGEIVKKFFANAKFYIVDCMMIKRSELCPIDECTARKLEPKDASQLVLLRGESTEKIRDWSEILNRLTYYGVFVDDKLVSIAGALIELPEIWVIGGVYTHPDFRNMGFATQATYGVTKEALEKVEAVILFVRSDNYPAIKVYEKIGYRKIDERLWVDVGTGLKP